MLDFNTVRMRGAARVALAATEGSPCPPHVYVVEPLVTQLTGPDYNADNGAMLAPHEAQNLASMLGQMAYAMDALEHAKTGLEEQVRHLESILIESEESADVRRRWWRDRALWVAAILMWVTSIVVGLAF